MCICYFQMYLFLHLHPDLCWMQKDGGNKEMYVVEWVYDDENKKKKETEWRAVSLCPTHSWKLSQMELSIIRNTRSSRKTKCKTNTHTIHILCEDFAKMFKIHSERTKTGIESTLGWATTKKTTLGRSFIDLWWNSTIQNWLHRFIWLLLISLLLPLCDGRMSFVSDKNHHRYCHNTSSSSHTTENHYPSQNDLMM